MYKRTRSLLVLEALEDRQLLDAAPLLEVVVPPPLPLSISVRIVDDPAQSIVSAAASIDGVASSSLSLSAEGGALDLGIVATVDATLDNLPLGLGSLASSLITSVESVVGNIGPSVVIDVGAGTLPVIGGVGLSVAAEAEAMTLPAVGSVGLSVGGGGETETLPLVGDADVSVTIGNGSATPPVEGSVGLLLTLGDGDGGTGSVGGNIGVSVNIGDDGTSDGGGTGGSTHRDGSNAVLVVDGLVPAALKQADLGLDALESALLDFAAELESSSPAARLRARAALVDVDVEALAPTLLNANGSENLAGRADGDSLVLSEATLLEELAAQPISLEATLQQFLDQVERLARDLVQVLAGSSLLPWLLAAAATAAACALARRQLRERSIALAFEAGWPAGSPTPGL